MNLFTISELYRKVQVCKSSLFLTSHDGCDHQAAKLALEKEKNAKSMGFRCFVAVQVAFAEAPGASRKKIHSIAKVNEFASQTTQ